MTRSRLVRSVVLTVLGIVIAGLVAALGIRLWGHIRMRAAIERFEREGRPFRVDAFVPEAVPDSENAVVWLARGVTAVYLDPSRPEESEALHSCPTEGPSPVAVEVLDRNRPALELLDRARGMRRNNWSIPYDDYVRAKIPDLQQGMYAARLVVCEGRTALSRGDFEGAARAVETTGVLARSYDNEPVVVLQLVGNAAELFQLRLIREIVADPRAGDGLVRRVSSAILDNDRIEQWNRAMSLEGLVTAKMAMREERGPSAWVLSELLTSTYLDRNRDIREVARGPVRPLEEVSATLRSKGGRLGEWLGEFPNLVASGYRSRATAAVRALARAAIAARLGEPAGGTDPLTGEAYVYRRNDDGSATLSAPALEEVTAETIVNFDRGLCSWPLPLTPTSSSSRTSAAPRETPPPRP